MDAGRPNCGHSGWQRLSPKADARSCQRDMPQIQIAYGPQRADVKFKLAARATSDAWGGTRQTGRPTDRETAFAPAASE